MEAVQDTSEKKAADLKKVVGEKYEAVVPNRLFGEILPAITELMTSDMPGPVAHATAKNWKYIQRIQKRIQELNDAELKKHCELDEKGNVKFSVKEGDRQPTADFKSVDAKNTYQEWWNEFATNREFDLQVHVIRQRDLEMVPRIKPATIVSLEYMIYDPDQPTD